MICAWAIIFLITVWGVVPSNSIRTSMGSVIFVLTSSIVTCARHPLIIGSRIFAGSDRDRRTAFPPRNENDAPASLHSAAKRLQSTYIITLWRNLPQSAAAISSVLKFRRNKGSETG